MKKQLYIYAVLIAIFIFYNQFFRVDDDKTHTVINILFSSFLFLYIGYLAFVALRKIRKTSKK